MRSPETYAKREPGSGIGRLIRRLRTGGWNWVKRRIAAEATSPTTRPGQTLHRLARRGLGVLAAVPRAVRRSRAAKTAELSETLVAFYDLKVAPITFDFLWFLVAADLDRRRRGMKSVHVVIVPGPHDGVRREHDDYEAVVSAGARQIRIRNVLAEACRFLPSCSGLTVAATRQEGAAIRATAPHVFPADYEPLLPVFAGPHSCLAAARAGETGIACLRAPAQELQVVDRWIEQHAGARKVVTVTLRRYDYMPARNSRVPEWVAFARKLDRARYLPVFVPDTNDLTAGMAPELSEFAVYPEAARDIALRMALYERAYLNLGVNNGPKGLAWLNERVRYATLKIETPEVPQANVAFMRTLGFERGKSLPFATPMQEWVWEDDTEDAISRAFVRLIEKIDGGSPESGRPS